MDKCNSPNHPLSLPRSIDHRIEVIPNLRSDNIAGVNKLEANEQDYKAGLQKHQDSPT